MALARIFSNYITKILRVFKNRDSILMTSCQAHFINLCTQNLVLYKTLYYSPVKSASLKSSSSNFVDFSFLGLSYSSKQFNQGKYFHLYLYICTLVFNFNAHYFWIFLSTCFLDGADEKVHVLYWLAGTADSSLTSIKARDHQLT